MDCTIVKRIEKMLSSYNRQNETTLKSLIDMIGNINVKCGGKTLARIVMEEDNVSLLKYLLDVKKAKLDRDDIVYGYTISDLFISKFLIDKGIKIPESDYHFVITIRENHPTMVKYLTKRQPLPLPVAKRILRLRDLKTAKLVINKTYMKSLNNKDRKTLETGFIRMRKIPPGTSAVSDHLKKRNRKTLTRLLGNKQLTKHYLTMKGLPRNLVRKIMTSP